MSTHKRIASPETVARLRAAALQQPGAVERATGWIKFPCPACRAEGYDDPGDNAGVDTEGQWGCAWATDTDLGCVHWDAIGRVLGAFAATPNGHDSTASWPVPDPIPQELRPVPAFDVDALLPYAFAPWVRDIAERSQSPADYIGVAVMVAAAAVVGRRVAIRPKRQDDWTVVPNLWGVAAGRPGSMKSPSIAEALRPLYRLVADARAEYERQMAAHEFLAAEAVAQRETLKKRLKDAIAKHEPTDGLRHAFEAPGYTAPTERRYLVNDATVEKLGALLNENPNGLLVYRDELLGLIRIMDRQGHENDRAFYCEAWNGIGRYVYDRIGRGTLVIESACVSLLGGVQPGPLHAYLREVFGAGASDDGFIQRFQLMVYPDLAPAFQNIDRWPNTDAKQRAYEIFRGLAQFEAERVGAQQLSPDELPFLRFAPEAQARFDAWRVGLETLLRAEDEHPVLLSHFAKYRSLMPSLALLLHLIDCLARGTGGPVEVAAAERAIAWCRYLDGHARRVYEAVTDAPRLAAARLARRIRTGQLTSPFRARTVYRHGWSAQARPGSGDEPASRYRSGRAYLGRQGRRRQDSRQGLARAAPSWHGGCLYRHATEARGVNGCRAPSRAYVIPGAVTPRSRAALE